MAERNYEQKRIDARNARRKVYTEIKREKSFFEQMSEDELNEFNRIHIQESLKVRKRREFKKNVLKYMGVTLAIVISVLTLIPIFFTFLNSFMTSAEIEDNYGMVFSSMSGVNSEGATYMTESHGLKLVPQQVTIDQYKELLFMSPSYLLKYWNSIILTVPIVVGQLAVACLASYSFARYRRKRREILFFSYVILMLMPFQVTLVPNYLIADSIGILDTQWSIILPGIFSTFAIFLLTKYMRRIPNSYYEAAMLDGASEWQIFTKIALPMCKSAIFALLILLFIDYWNMVEQPVIMLSDTAKQPLSVFLSQINGDDMGIAFAASALYMLPPLLIFLWGEEYLVEGISNSGIK